MDPVSDAPVASGDRRPRGLKRPSRARRVLVVVTTGLCVVALLTGVYSFFLIARITRFDVDLHEPNSGGRTYLIVGVDSRENLSAEQQAAFGSTPLARADIVLVLRVPDDGSGPVLLSIPRDLLILGNDSGLHRLALEWLAGPQAFVDTMCRSLGIGADHLVRVELAGFIEIVDAVGGIDVEFASALRDTVIDFSVEEGVQHLDGARALQYVRARHLEYSTAYGWFPYDNARDGRAQTVLERVAGKAEIGRGPLALHRLVWGATGAVAVDDSTGLRDLAGMARAMRQVSPEHTLALPVEPQTGPIPFAEAGPEAPDLLERVGAGGECAVPVGLGARDSPGSP